VTFPANNVEKCGNVIAVADSRGEAVEAAERGIAAIGIRLRPLTDTTTRFLFHATAHSAYAAAAPDMLTALDAMAPFRGIPAQAASREAILIEPLAGFERNETRDWHGTPFTEAVRLALHHGGAVMHGGTPGGRFVLSGLFWRAMVRGSAQGGVYLLDSVRQAAGRGRLMEFLAGL
jgi:hypothetical protein